MEANSQLNLHEKLNSYVRSRAVDLRAIHGLSLKTGLLCSIFLCNNLLHGYTVQSKINDARKLFDEIPLPNVVSWSAMISAYAQIGKLKDSVVLFKKMLLCREEEGEGEDEDGLLPNKFTFGSILKGCTCSRDLGTGVQFHCGVVKSGIDSDTFVANILLDMYGKCGALEACWGVFKHTLYRDVVTWTTIIANLANYGKEQFGCAAFGLFKDMMNSGVWPVGFTFVSLVKIFDDPDKLNNAKQVHGCVVKLGIEVDDHLRSSLITMYGKCQGLEEAVRLSDRMDRKDAVSWTSLLVGYLQNGFRIMAIDVFRSMVNAKAKIDPFVVASALGACVSPEEIGIGKEIHGYAVRNCFLTDVAVGNALITLYGRCGEIRKAELVFRVMKSRDSISWTALLTCYGQSGYGEEALFLFLLMIQEGLTPPIFSITGAIRACSTVTSLSVGEQIHARIAKTGVNHDLSLEDSLITMYSKCGNIDSARNLFNSMSRRDTISWNALIAGLSQHGFETEALELFYKMQDEGIQPDDFTFLGVLVACSHVGLVDEGLKYFKSMGSVYKLEPKMEHHACMVDLFGRAGKLNDALEFISSMSFDPDHLVWEALLKSCKVHGNVELAKVAAEKILLARPDDPSAYTVLSNIHASMSMWDRKAQVLNMMKDRGVHKEPSRSWVEIKGTVHAFSANDTSHPLIHLIHWKLTKLKAKMDEAGHVTYTNIVLHDVSQEQKELSLLYHSEKLALAFALITTTEGMPIRIMQNVRCCGDCHAALKLISKIEDRNIVLGDRNRFHHFKHGVCTCNDYW